MPLPDDDRLALAARLATTAPAAVDVVAEAIEDGEELREVLVDVQGEVVALTRERVLFVSGTELRAFDYDAIDVQRRDEGLGIDARPEGDRLVLDVARSTFVRLGVVAEGNPPGRATWLPVRAPEPRPEPEPPPVPEALDAPDAPRAPRLPAGPPPPPEAAWGPRMAPVPAAPPPPQSALPPPGWHPDPSGRHWWRWWDGRGWTAHVADGGAPYVDPLPPR